MHSYRVRTVCKATVRESWSIRSPHPLTDDQVREIVEDGEEIEGVEIVHWNDEVSDEEDREVTEIEKEAAHGDDDAG